MKKLSKDELIEEQYQRQKAFNWLHTWIRFYVRKFIPSLRSVSKKRNREVLREQKVVYKYLKQLIEAQEPSEKPKVNREWVYYFCAYINAGHKSLADDKARVEHAIKKLKEAGVEVKK